jgi:hypothetical protein
MSFWRRHFLAIETLAVLVLFSVFVGWSERLGGWAALNAQLTATRSTLYSTTATLTGSLLGFVIAAFAISVSSFGSARLKPVAEHVEALVTTFTAATVYLGAATVFSLLALILDRDGAPLPWLFYAVVFWLLLSISTLTRCVWVLYNVVSIIGAPSKARSGDT